MRVFIVFVYVCSHVVFQLFRGDIEKLHGVLLSKSEVILDLLAGCKSSNTTRAYYSGFRRRLSGLG